jgi:hypothetical protein
MYKLALMAVLASAGVAFAGPVQSHHAAGSHAWMPPNPARGVLWDQSIASGNATVDQNFPDFPDYTSGMVDDFSTGAQAWNITKVTTYYTRGVGNWSDDVAQAQLSLFTKAGSIPGEPDRCRESRPGRRVARQLAGWAGVGRRGGHVLHRGASEHQRRVLDRADARGGIRVVRAGVPPAVGLADGGRRVGDPQRGRCVRVWDRLDRCRLARSTAGSGYVVHAGGRGGSEPGIGGGSGRMAG